MWKRYNQIRVIAYKVILITLLLFGSMQFNEEMVGVSYASTISDPTSYVEILQAFDNAEYVDEAYEVINKANFMYFTDENIYDLLSITYAKEKWQEPRQNITVEHVRLSIAEKGCWMNHFTEKRIKDANTAHPSYYLVYKWPDNYGFIEGTEDRIILPEGTLIDRYGYPGGSYLWPVDVPYKERVLNPGTKETKPYFIYKVKESFKVQSGNIHPWFGVGTEWDSNIY